MNSLLNWKKLGGNVIFLVKHDCIQITVDDKHCSFKLTFSNVRVHLLLVAWLNLHIICDLYLAFG